MKRLVKLRQGYLELEIKTYRDLPRFLRKRAPSYSVLITRYGSDGWSVGDAENPAEGWIAGTGQKLSGALTEFAGIDPDEAETIAFETIAEWKRRAPGVSSR